VLVDRREVRVEVTTVGRVVSFAVNAYDPPLFAGSASRILP
jgi:hypothetical protein